MNKVYLSGVIIDDPSFVAVEGRAPHLVLGLSVTHRALAGIKSEVYRVSAWNGSAIWGSINLKRGMPLMVQGYLSQHQIATDNGTTNIIDIAVVEFFVGSGRFDKPAQDQEPRTARCDGCADDVSLLHIAPASDDLSLIE